MLQAELEPGALLGEALVQRLRDHAEITFAVEE